MRIGIRNRLMRWTGIAIPFKPGRRGLVAATERSLSILSTGRIVSVAGEGRIHAGEKTILPIEPGVAYLALRAGVPVVPVAVNGTGWLRFRGVVRLRVGAPIYGKALVHGHPSPAEVERLAEETHAALQRLVADFPDTSPPGCLERWLTELFNEWPAGERPGLAPGSHGATGAARTD